MASITGKRKRVHLAVNEDTHSSDKTKKPKQVVQQNGSAASSLTTAVQIVTGDYERVLHGLVATVPTTSADQDSGEEVSWTETFLFSAHTAAIRCVAISPVAKNGKRFLATGSSDERINIYSISNVMPSSGSGAVQPTLNGTVVAENAGNRSLGSLNHHDRATTKLHFPSKSKLFSAAEDNLVAISRTRDWTMLSSIKAPIPKVHGRPSGDTAVPGEVPTGINDFAIHPSQKLMLTVSRGERSMRLWNLMTGKKAGVLNFDRDLLVRAGETKFSSGEGRRVLWDESGEHYVVGFERGAVLFGIDSKPQAVLRPTPATKIHQYHTVVSSKAESVEEVLALSTEDGRILFYSLTAHQKDDQGRLPELKCIAQIGGRAEGVQTRLKDFQVLNLQPRKDTLLVVAAGSDGTVWLWSIDRAELRIDSADSGTSLSIGHLLGKHKTESRITCLDAFIMESRAEQQQGEAIESSLNDSSSEDA